ncbi:hypothetical protein RF11_09273 [Thelohanellus kitauei]|uniref:Uncharacterized protein n=1 Tax=Thelohanellus kitauei TaxID=669202 RepID=A0A0C2J6R8_THEKT|nr:hypothetical protein RF11_09273 [Thelohanellus kitauei]
MWLVNSRKKVIKSLKLLLSDRADYPWSENSVSTQKERICLLGIQLLYRIADHIEFNESIRVDFLDIIINFLKNHNSVLVTQKLEFIKDIFESHFVFSNLFLIYSTQAYDSNCDFILDWENIINITNQIGNFYNNKCYAEKILFHKCIIMLLLTIDEIIIDRFEFNHQKVIDKCCKFHQHNQQPDISSNFIKKSIKNGHILNLPTFKIFALDQTINEFRHKKKYNEDADCPITQLISRKISLGISDDNGILKYNHTVLKATSKSENVLNLDSPRLKSIRKAKSCILLNYKSSSAGPLNSKKSLNNLDQKKTVVGRKIAVLPEKTSGNQPQMERNSKLKVPPKNINPQRKFVALKKLPVKTKNDKTKKEETNGHMFYKFLDELTEFIKHICSKNPSNFVKIDRKIQKFSSNFLKNLFAESSKTNIIPYFDLYAEDIYYCTVFILCLVNHVDDISTFNFEEFYDYKFYSDSSNNLINEFKRMLIKHLGQNLSSMVVFRIPEECVVLKNFLFQTATLIFPKNGTKHTSNVNEKKMVYEPIFEHISRIYLDSWDKNYEQAEANYNDTMRI